MLLKYFYDQNLAHASYMVGCQRTGEALVVDPARDIAPYLETAVKEGLRIVGAAETHIHADYVSGARELAAQTGATLYLSDEGDENWKYLYADAYNHKPLKDGNTFAIGNIKFEAMHTPGHTPEHMSYIITDMGGGADRPMGIFTGDFVFVGSVGRPDLLEKAAGIANTSAVGAMQMFASLNRFKELPDYMQVWPGHGAGSACGKGLGAIPSSTVGYEKLFNPMLGYDDIEEFVSVLLDGQPEPPTYFAVMKRVNKEGPAVLGPFTMPPQLETAVLPQMIADGAMVIDTNELGAFAQAHVPGTINIPSGSLAAWAGWLVDYTKPVYLITEPQQVETAAKILAEIGIDALAGYFAAKEVAAADLMSESYGAATAVELAEQIQQGAVTLVDVRNQTEWDEGHLPNAKHIMLGTLWQRVEEVGINGRSIVVQCRSGARSAIGASILQARGAKHVINLTGGYIGWTAAGLPVEQ
jgi:hydroxyacylglutathione hydrolase